MATGKSGTFDLTMDNSFVVRIVWREIYEAIANNSTLDSIRAYLYSDAWTGSWYPQGTISVDGKAVVTMSYAAPASHRTDGSVYKKYAEIVKCGNGVAPPWTSAAIAHNTDGSKNVTITVDLEVYNAETNVIRDLGSYSKTIALTHIPRASVIGATDANIGAVSMIAVTKKSSSYTHSIAYKFGSLSGYLTAAGGISTTEVKMSDASIAFKLPDSFYAQIPNAKSGVCTLTCRTYSGNTQIGDAQTTTFVVTAALASCVPSVQGTVVDINAVTKALTGSAGKFVRFYSTAHCEITATAKNGASISQKKIGGTVVDGNSLTISEIEAASIAFYAKDSRGYEDSVAVPLDLVPYVKLTSNPSAKRTNATDGNAILTLKGNYYNGSFGAAANSLTVRYRIAVSGGSYGSYVTVAPVLRGNAYSLDVALSGLTYTNAYMVEVVVSDKLASITKTVLIDPGIPVADWGKNDWEFHVPVSISGGFSVIVLPDGTDLDTLTIPNTYAGDSVLTAAYKNAPATSGTFTLEVLPAGALGQVFQRYTFCSKTDAAVYVRFYYQDTWGDWVQM